MLGKLLKHEFRATGRIMLPLIAAELLVSVLAGLSVRGLARMQNMSFLRVLNVMTLLVFGLGLFAIAVVAFVLMIQRFYKSLLRDEGYLSMTLPVTVDMHIWAKLLTSFAWFAAVGLLSMAAILLVMRIGTDMSWASFYGIEWDESVFNFERIGGGSIALYILESVLLAFLYAAATCLHCYAAMAVGCSASDHKLLLSFVAYFLMGMALSVVTNALAFSILPHTDVWIDSMGPAAAIHAAMGVNILIAAALFALYYFVTRYFLKNKLNLA